MKKLVLYSDQIISENKKIDSRMMEQIGKSHPKIGFIPSCSDKERTYFTQKIEYYGNMGIQNLVYFDLDEEYRETKIEELFSYDAIHLSGGNVFYFLYLMKKRNFFPLLTNYVQTGGVS